MHRPVDDSKERGICSSWESQERPGRGDSRAES